MHLPAIAVALSLAAAAPKAPPAPAQPPAPAKEQPPAPAAPRDFKLPERRELKLDNGLAVTLVPFGTIPKVDVALVLRTGNIHEAENQVWLADITADMLAEGTTTRTAEQLHEEAARMGGELATSVTPDETLVSGGALAEFAPGMVELVADVARNPRFAPGELERLKTDRQRLVAILRAEPQALVEDRFAQAMYPGHPYGRTFPTAEMLAAYTVQDVRSFYDANFGAQRAHLYVVGQFDAAAVEASVREAFAGWQKGPPKVDLIPKPAAQGGIHIIDRPGAVQSTIQMGVPALSPADPDAIKYAIMNALLGGASTSRITSNIRERKGYTYSPYSTVTRFRLSAYWSERADVTTAVTGDSLKEIYAEIDRLQREPPSEEELQAVKNYVAGTFILSNTARSGIIARLRYVGLNDLPADYLETYVRNVMATTPQDVQRLAKSISRANMIVVIAGDRKQIEKQVRPYGELVVMPAK